MNVSFVLVMKWWFIVCVLMLVYLVYFFSCWLFVRFVVSVLVIFMSCGFCGWISFSVLVFDVVILLRIMLVICVCVVFRLELF